MTDKPEPILSELIEAYPYVYFWHRMNRKGQPCAVTARGKMNSCCVVFEDGFSAITSRNAIRRRARAALEGTTK